jgi:hypothetical protein
MGTTLIFVGQRVVTNSVCCLWLLDSAGCEGVPGNSPRIKTVPETDTGGLVEHTKALERTMLKELGNLPP